MELKTCDIEVSIDSQKILDKVSIIANKKQRIGIIGPNGSGKSTLLKCIYRVLRPNDGAVFLDGKQLESYKVRESAKKLAVVSQHNFYNFDFTIEEVVMMGRAPHKKALEHDNEHDYEIVNKAIKQVGMENFKDRNFSTLSGGEQQRIILARALAQQTKCIILDEPTNHLDIKYQLQLLSIVKALDITVVSAIHDLNMALAFFEYLYVMKDGKVYAEGETKSVITSRLIKEVYDVEADVIEHKGNIHVVYGA